MKNKTTLIMLFCFMFTINAFGQDTLNVPAFFSDSGAPALLDFILADTLDGGVRANPNRVYRLGRDSVYIMRGQLLVDFNLNIIADDDPNNKSVPPIIIGGVYDDGANVKDPFVFVKDELDIYFKNIIFTGMDLERNVGGWSGAGKYNSDNTRATYESCVFNQWGWVLYSNGKNNSLFIKDCSFRNNNSNAHPFVGQQVYCGGVPLDTLEITNTTYFNNNAFIVGLENNITKYFRFEHNTIFTTTVDPIRVRNLTNAKILSNIFYGTHAIGEKEEERTGGWYTSNGKHASIIDLDTVATDLMEGVGLTEADRNILIKGNVYFWPQAIKDFYEGNVDVTAPVWMNEGTQLMFNNKSNYPLLVAENNIEENPIFTDTDMESWMITEIVDYATKYRNGVAMVNRNYDAETNNGEILMLQWPLPESMVYSNETVLSAGHDGLPAGDLNWFPEKKKEWELIISIRKDEGDHIPQNFLLQQNYPNPFNPTTIISFNIPSKEMVSLKVFNALGQEVSTLINKELNSGSYNYELDGSNLTSGIYFYKLKTNKFSQVKKMMLVK